MTGIHLFGQLCIGDLFNTKSARWVKTEDDEAICVMSGTYPVGKLCRFGEMDDVVVLWSAVLNAGVD